MVDQTEKDCGICTQKIEESYQSPCNHEFCLSCILMWSNTLNAVNVATTCPMCRADVDRQGILDLHALKLRNESQERQLSIENFLRLRHVQLQPHGYQLIIKPDNEWIANLKSVITLMKKSNSENRLSASNRLHNNSFNASARVSGGISVDPSTLFLKIGDKNLVFETPILQCYYHSGLNEPYNTGPYFLSRSDNNDFSVFEQLDEVFKEFLAEPGFDYGYLLKKPQNVNAAPISCLKFQLGVHKDTPNIPLSSLFTNTNNDDPKEIVSKLKDKCKYSCRILFSISFIKITSTRTTYPKMRVVYVKCDEMPQQSKYAFLADN